MKINKKLIKELVDNLEEFKLSELEYSEKDIKVKVSRYIQFDQNISSEVTTEKNLKSSTHLLNYFRRQFSTFI